MQVYTEQNPIRVIMADDHSLVRSGIRKLLEGQGDIEVVDEAANGKDMLTLAQNTIADIALMDIAMPELNGIETAVRMKEQGLPHKVILLSMYANEEYVIRALRVGVKGYLIKDAAPDELDFAVRAVAGGQTYLSPSISRQVIDDYILRVNSGDEDSDPLTSRQREILQLLAEGNNTKNIAYKLDLSAKTVETHRAEIMRRLKIHDVPGLVRYAIRIGLVSPDL